MYSIQIPPFTPLLKWIVGVHFSLWLVFVFIGVRFFDWPIFYYYGLTPRLFWEKGWIWQLFTYMGLHTIDVSHLILNLLMTWFIGSELERIWGPRKWLLRYLGYGWLAGMIYVGLLGAWNEFIQPLPDSLWNTPVVGSSGALFGLLTSYGLIFRQRRILFMMMFPIPAYYLVLILGGIEFLSLLGSGLTGSPVAHLAHLGGILAAWLIHRLSGIIPLRGRSGKKLHIIVNNEKNSGDKIRYWN